MVMTRAIVLALLTVAASSAVAATDGPEERSKHISNCLTTTGEN